MLSNPGYHAFIEDAFIRPIRSVLIVDDDYPTYSEILDTQSIIVQGGEIPESAKLWLKNPSKIKKVVESFRKRPLLVDIHDGRGGDGNEEKLAYHLHQSDLLVLDYQLDGANGDGTRAIEIARSVMSNNHFNLVVVHTSANLESAFREMLLGLMSPCAAKPSRKDAARREELIQAAELENDKILELLRAEFKEEQYFRYRKDAGAAFTSFRGGEQPFLKLLDICTAAKWDGADLRNMFRWMVEDFEARSVMKMQPAGKHAQPQWSEEDLWIRSKSGFIAFTNKTNGDVDILQELWRSLIAWSPKPSRLFLTKLRSELEEFGVAAEDAALGNDYVLARWYSELLKGDDLERRTLIGVAISRHSEQLLDYVQKNVRKFAEHLVSADAAGPLVGNDLVKMHFKIDLGNKKASDRADEDHNVFACTKSPQGWHLQTGHIFTGADAFWVCLSPSCDLVPGQRKTGLFKEISDQMPFLAVRLKRWDEEDQPPDVHSNRYIFLESDKGKKNIFCINEPNSPNSSPHWYPLYAANLGKFDDDDKKSFFFTKLKIKEGKLIAVEYPATVVGQLRYEYAINLAQMLGANFTRIGLDFIGPDNVAQQQKSEDAAET
jgi:CheY-like chemotaxis protein